jgi:hypothetical protein
MGGCFGKGVSDVFIKDLKAENTKLANKLFESIDVDG